MKDFKFEISGCSCFQRESVKNLYNKFYVEKKNKLVLADEVGMGKTYVCKGLIENAKEEDKEYNVFYVSPNDIITKQNHKELCKGFISKPTKAVRLSELEEKKQGQEYGFYSFSASMFFSSDIKTPGTEEERLRICSFLYSVFECGKTSNNEEIQEWASKNELYVQMIIAAFFKPEKRYYYYVDDKPDEKALEDLCSDYERWISNVQEGKETIQCEELEWCIDYLRKEVASTIDFIKLLIKSNDINNLIELVESQYKLPEKRTKIEYGNDSTLKKDEKYELIKKLVIPYYTSETDIVFYTYFNWYRKFMNKVNYRRIKPNLIILDEFHKYFDNNVKKILDEYVELCPETKILFVSATPYKMSIKSEEFMPGYMKNDPEYDDVDEAEKEKKNKSETNISCFNGYYDLYAYISGEENDDLKNALKKIRENIEKLSQIENRNDFVNLLNACTDGKNKTEDILKKYIIRTERHRLISENINYVEKGEEINTTPAQYRYEAEQFKKINSVLQSPDMTLLYIKMAPFPMSFSQGYKSLKVDEKNIENKNLYDEGVFWDGQTEPDHYRYQALKGEALPNENTKKWLWIPPSKVDENNLGGVWKDSHNYTKTLVFARHIMTTKSIAAILSAQINRKEQDVVLSDDIFKIQQEDFMYSIFNDALKDYCDDETVKKNYSKELVESFYQYLKTHQNVLINAGVKNKDTLKDYCEQGCLKETLIEYFFVLTKGKRLSDDDIESIKNALKNQETSVTYFTRDGLGSVNCSFAEMFNIDCKASHEVREIMNIRFNSPFYPFVLTTTPIAQEGINFQNYCHRIMHWRLPVSPIDFEQREGRINRYRNHAVRKSLAKGNERKTWNEIFGIDETMNGLSPNWIADVEDPVKIESLVVNHKLSKEETVHKMLKKAVNAYRISLGYGVSKSILDKIQEKAEKHGLKVHFDEILIDLSPVNEKYEEI